MPESKKPTKPIADLTTKIPKPGSGNIHTGIRDYGKKGDIPTVQNTHKAPIAPPKPPSNSKR